MKPIYIKLNPSGILAGMTASEIVGTCLLHPDLHAVDATDEVALIQHNAAGIIAELSPPHKEPRA